MTRLEKMEQSLDELERYLEANLDAHPTVVEVWQDLKIQLIGLKEELKSDLSS